MFILKAVVITETLKPPIFALERVKMKNKWQVKIILTGPRASHKKGIKKGFHQIHICWITSTLMSEGKISAIKSFKSHTKSKKKMFSY